MRLHIGAAEIFMGLLCLVLILAITAIAQPPNKWVEWWMRRHGDKTDKR